MATKEYKFRQQLKKKLKLTLETFPNGKYVKYKYNVLRYTLLDFYPTMVNSMTKDDCLEMLRAVIYLDRQLRLETEGVDEEEKEILAQEKQIELGYTQNYQRDVKAIQQNARN